MSEPADEGPGVARPEHRTGWGLVGLGRHAQRYVGPAFARSRTARLVATCSRDPRRAREFAAEHAAEGARVHDSLEELLADDAVECVFVCSENALHAEHVRACAEAGRHVLAEKPLSTTPESSREVVEACEKAGVTLAVGFHLRHNPAHAEARRLVRGGALGTVLFAQVEYVHLVDPSEPRLARRAWRSDRSRGGGEFVGTGIHTVDFSRFLLGDDVERVQATRREPLPDGRRAIMMTLGMASGAAVAITIGRNTFAGNGVSVVGTGGLLHLSGSVGHHGGGTLTLQRDGSAGATTFQPADVYARELDDFAGLLAGHDVPSAAGADAVRAAEIVDGLEQALATGREVRA